MLIQYILIVIILLIILQTIRKFRSHIIGLREFLFWAVLWVAVGITVLLPRLTSFLANYLGVGRGADLVVYGSLIFVFYMIFRLFARQERMEKNISKIVEEIAKKK
jgi:small membrane protein